MRKNWNAETGGVKLKSRSSHWVKAEFSNMRPFPNRISSSFERPFSKLFRKSFFRKRLFTGRLSKFFQIFDEKCHRNVRLVWFTLQNELTFIFPPHKCDLHFVLLVLEWRLVLGPLHVRRLEVALLASCVFGASEDASQLDALPGASGGVGEALGKLQSDNQLSSGRTCVDKIDHRLKSMLLLRVSSIAKVKQQVTNRGSRLAIRFVRGSLWKRFLYLQTATCSRPLATRYSD